MKWISCEDDLPGYLQIVLAFDGTKMRICIFSYSDARWLPYRFYECIPGCRFNLIENITHWMPAPELPGEDR